ncbi:MAG: CAP domain-containing protein [Bacillota bacterium]|nr:CAP domain-containing protein [Bacillota bacterium]
MDYEPNTTPRSRRNGAIVVLSLLAIALLTTILYSATRPHVTTVPKATTPLTSNIVNPNTNTGAVNQKMSADFCHSGCNYTTADISKILSDYRKYCSTNCTAGAKPSTTSVAGGKSAQVSNYDAEIKSVVDLVNKERTSHGLKAIARRTDIEPAAAIRAKEISTKFSHTRPNGKRGLDILKEYKITTTCSGENIAEGYSTAQQVMKGWMNSTGHRANILRSNFTGLGVGVYKQGNTMYWVQIFVG